MNFTREDILKIKQALDSYSVRDSELQNANLPIQYNDTLSIVQNGTNKKVNVQDFIAQVGLLAKDDIINITEKFNKPNITLEEAIQTISYSNRKEGLIITFQDENSDWRLFQFRGSINQFNNASLWKDLYNFDEYIIDSVLPDEEDLTVSRSDDKGNSYLSLKDKEYDPENFSGMATKILRKHIIEVDDLEFGKVKKNILYQDDFNQENCIYEIKYDFDLNNQTITIPNNCILKFNGGKLINGILKGKVKNHHLKVDNFCEDNEYCDQGLQNILNIGRGITIIFSKNKTYKLKDKFYFNTPNTKIYGNGSLIDAAKGLRVIDTNNVVISDLNVTLNVEYKQRTSDNPNDGSEYWNLRNSFKENMGFWITNSTNVIFNNVTVFNSPTGICSTNSSDIIINNCYVHHTIADSFTFFQSCKNCIVQNCKSEYSGDDSFACVSNRGLTNNYLENNNISFINCCSENSGYAGICVHGGYNILIKNINIVNSRAAGIRIFATKDVTEVYTPYNINIENVSIYKNTDASLNPTNTVFMMSNIKGNESITNVSIKNCIFSSDNYFKCLFNASKLNIINCQLPNAYIEYSKLVNINSSIISNSADIEIISSQNIQLINNIINSNFINLHSVENLIENNSYSENTQFVVKDQQCKNIQTKLPYLAHNIKTVENFNLKTREIMGYELFSGIFSKKPNNPPTGFGYLCTDKKTSEGNNNGIMIYYKGNGVWIDALGRTIE